MRALLLVVIVFNIFQNNDSFIFDRSPPPSSLPYRTTARQEPPTRLHIIPPVPPPHTLGVALGNIANAGVWGLIGIMGSYASNSARIDRANEKRWEEGRGGFGGDDNDEDEYEFDDDDGDDEDYDEDDEILSNDVFRR
jgi:hypothetical protein